MSFTLIESPLGENMSDTITPSLVQLQRAETSILGSEAQRDPIEVTMVCALIFFLLSSTSY